MVYKVVRVLAFSYFWGVFPFALGTHIQRAHGIIVKNKHYMYVENIMLF